MTLKEARKINPGAIVRESWGHEFNKGLVLAKTYVKEVHRAKMLCQTKKERYDIVVHWMNGPRSAARYKNPNTHQSWELMVLKHV
jgi:hypothetical protein